MPDPCPNCGHRLVVHEIVDHVRAVVSCVRCDPGEACWLIYPAEVGKRERKAVRMLTRREAMP